MPELLNDSVYSAGLYPGFNVQGQPQHVLVVKAVYPFDNTGALMTLRHSTIEEHDQWRGKPAQSSLQTVNDIAPFKMGGEIILQGQVTLPHQHYHVIDVVLGIEKMDLGWQKGLRLFGARHWQKKGLQASMSFPDSLSCIELCYENAYGGVCEKTNHVYALNPVGKGYVGRERYADGLALPQLEFSEHLIKRPLQRVAPACYAARPLQWSPLAKDFSDDAWRRSQHGKYPKGNMLPNNFYNSAPLDQQFLTPFQAGDTISLTGMLAGVSLSKAVTLTLPEARPNINIVGICNEHSQHLVLDTVKIDIGQQTLSLLWRLSIVESENPVWVAVSNG